MPMPLLGRLLRYGGGKLLDSAVTRVVPPSGGWARLPGPLGAICGAALMRIATRSVPGAIIVGGGLVAKTLHDRRKARAEQAGRQPSAPADPQDDADAIG